MSSLSSLCSCVHSKIDCVFTLEDVLSRSLPSKTQTSNRQIFTLARGIKALEAQGSKFTTDALKDIFYQWHARAVVYLKQDQTREDYLMEFFQAYHRAKIPLGSGLPQQAWELVQTEPQPPAAAQFENDKLRLLVSFCFQLQRLTGRKPFYLSSRMGAGFLQQPSHTTCDKWLKALCGMEILKEVKKGDTHLATEYRYL
jgi:hypothetical protein